jgi:hypothetical protein
MRAWPKGQAAFSPLPQERRLRGKVNLSLFSSMLLRISPNPYPMGINGLNEAFIGKKSATIF